MENENREPTEDADATEDLEVREDDAREIVGGVVPRKGGEGQIEDGQRPEHHLELQRWLQQPGGAPR